MIKSKTVVISTILLIFSISVAVYFTKNYLTSTSIEDFLPSDSEVYPWTIGEPLKVFGSRDLFELINGGADLFFEYGFKQVGSQKYINGKKSISVEIYEMNDSTSAFGIFSQNRDYRYPLLDIGSNAVQLDYNVSFWKNRFYVVVLSNDDDSNTKKNLIQFSKIISNKISGKSEKPTILKKLPQKGLIDGSDGYFKGLYGQNGKIFLTQKNLLEVGLSGVEGAFASYITNDDKANLLLVVYSEPNQAKRKQQNVSEVFTEDYKLMEENPYPLFNDKKGRYYAVIARGEVLFIVHKSTSKKIIDHILKQTNSEYL